MAPANGDAHDTCRIRGWCVRSYIYYLADYPVEKEGGTRRNVALSLQKGPSVYSLGQRCIPLFCIQYPYVCRNGL